MAWWSELERFDKHRLACRCGSAVCRCGLYCIRKVEKEMLDAARNLEFERAASLRDELKALRDRLLAVGGEG